MADQVEDGVDQAETTDSVDELRKRIADLEQRNHYLSQQNDMLRCRVSLLENLTAKDASEDEDVIEIRPVSPHQIDRNKLTDQNAPPSIAFGRLVEYPVLLWPCGLRIVGLELPQYRQRLAFGPEPRKFPRYKFSWPSTRFHFIPFPKHPVETGVNPHPRNEVGILPAV